MSFGPDLIVMESYPVQTVVEIVAVPPAEALMTQGVASYDLHGRWPVNPPVGSVTVRCRGKELARIAPVGTAH